MLETFYKMLSHIIVCVLIIIFDNMSEWLMEKLGIWCNSRDDDDVDDEVEQDCCPICLDINTDNVETTLCGHKYHHGCLADWEAHHRTCPVCRANLGPRHYFQINWFVP